MFKRKIQKGIKFLNSKFPGWFKQNRISTKKLNVFNPCDCILGQLSSSLPEFADNEFIHNYFSLRNHLFCDHNLYKEFYEIEAQKRGFNIDEKQILSLTPDQQFEVYKILTTEWKAAIRQLRKDNKKC